MSNGGAGVIKFTNITQIGKCPQFPYNPNHGLFRAREEGREDEAGGLLESIMSTMQESAVDIDCPPVAAACRQQTH